MSNKPVYDFSSVDYEYDYAHEGERKIYYSRVLRKQDGQPYHFVDLVRVPPDADIGIHTHALDNQEMYIFITGHGSMHVDGEEFAVGPGSVVINRPGGTHGLINTGSEEMQIVVVEVPHQPNATPSP